MHSNGSKYDTELQIPKKKIKLSPIKGFSGRREALLSQILIKEIQQEVNVRKEDLEVIEDNIFVTRQKLIHLKQLVADDYYRQKSVKGFLQHPPHPAVKDTYVGKCPIISETHRIVKDTDICKNPESACVNIKTEPVTEVDCTVNGKLTSNDLKVILENDKLPCYIAPKKVDGDDIKPAEPRDIHSKKEIRIIVGNVSKWLAPYEISDATHKWTVYAKIAEPDLDISLFVNKIVFFLHKSYRPNDVIEIRNPPFKLTRRGWGEFPLKAQFHFKSPSDPPIDVMHYLKLDHVHTGFETFGSETSLTVWVHFPVGYGMNHSVKTLSQSFVNNRIDNDDLNVETMINKSECNDSNCLEEMKMNCFDNANIINEIFSNSFLINDYSLKELDELNEKYDKFSFKLGPEHGSESKPSSSFLENISSKNVSSQSFENPSLPGETCSQQTTSIGHENQIENSINNLDELLVDECAVVAEEVVIDCDGHSDFIKNEFGEYNNTSYDDDVEDSKYAEGETDVTVLTSKSISDSYITEVRSNSGKQLDHIIKDVSLNNVIYDKKIDSSIAKKSNRNTEMIQNRVINNQSMNSEIVIDKSTNTITKNIDNLQTFPQQCSEAIDEIGSATNINKRLLKQSEKKSMIITLQKENGQIILRKEARIRRLKENTSKGGLGISAREASLNNNLSLLKSKAINFKQSPVLISVKKDPSLKLVSKITNSSPNNFPKKILPGVSLLKKVGNISKEDACHNLNDCDIIKQCPIQNTEIAINWLMKKFPLVDARSVYTGFHTKHPYCANSIKAFLKWPFAKQRAAEWMRAKAIGRIIDKIPGLEKWKTLEILDWARIRCYTPMKNDPEYNGPTIEPSLNFVFQPRINGILEFLKNHKMATEEEILDVVGIEGPNKEETLHPGNVESSISSRWSAYETDLSLPLSTELHGYKGYINRCMMNSTGELPAWELLLPGVVFPSVERVLISVFESMAEELIRRSYNASWIRHCDNAPADITISDVKAAVLSRKEFDFLLPCKDDKGKEQPSFISFFRK